MGGGSVAALDGAPHSTAPCLDRGGDCNSRLAFYSAFACSRRKQVSRESKCLAEIGPEHRFYIVRTPKNYVTKK